MLFKRKYIRYNTEFKRVRFKTPGFSRVNCDECREIGHCTHYYLCSIVLMNHGVTLEDRHYKYVL